MWTYINLILNTDPSGNLVSFCNSKTNEHLGNWAVCIYIYFMYIYIYIHKNGHRHRHNQSTHFFLVRQKKNYGRGWTFTKPVNSNQVKPHYFLQVILLNLFTTNIISILNLIHVWPNMKIASYVDVFAFAKIVLLIFLKRRRNWWR